MTTYLSDIATGNGGFKIVGEYHGDGAGWTVSSAGDVNGDGISDLLIGASANGQSGAAAYVIFGKTTPFGTVNLHGIAHSNGGFKIANGAGAVVSAVGDGIGDIAVGTPSDAQAGWGAGATYVVFGKTAPSRPVNLHDVADGEGGFKMVGENKMDFAGSAVSAAGDVNGDGIGDLLVCAPHSPGQDAGVGAAYVVFGKTTPFGMVYLHDVAQGSGGFKILGENPWDHAGSTVSAAGDINGDGIGDLLIGAPNNNSTGAAYAVFGKTTPFTTVNLREVADGEGGFKIVGEDRWGDAGRSVAAAGDGIGDLLVGAPQSGAGIDWTGAAYVVFGKETPFGTVNLHDIADGDGGFKIVAKPWEQAGFSVSSERATSTATASAIWRSTLRAAARSSALT